MPELETHTALPADKLAYRLRDAETVTGLCARTLVNYINLGKLKVVRKGRAILILRSELEKFLKRDDPRPVRWRPNGRGRPWRPGERRGQKS
jgi:hypothetical protein